MRASGRADGHESRFQRRRNFENHEHRILGWALTCHTYTQALVWSPSLVEPSLAGSEVGGPVVPGNVTSSKDLTSKELPQDVLDK
jgi:hypothetical protein